jgi:hypothetical protein
MRLVNKIDDLIKSANDTIDFLEIEMKKSDIDIWDRYYNRGYIASQKKYVHELNHLKNMMLKISLIQFGDDDDV